MAFILGSGWNVLEEGARGPYLKMVSVEDDLAVVLEVRKVHHFYTFSPRFFLIYYFITIEGGA